MQNPLRSHPCLTSVACLALTLAGPAPAQDWKQIQTATSPSGRDFHGMAFELGRARTVMFGGRTSGGYVNDTWSYNGKNWTQLKPTTSPGIRYAHAMVYDSKRGRLVVFGGRTPGSLNDTWEFDGTNWTQIKTKTSPPARGFHVLAYDSIFGKTILFGGTTDGSWGASQQDTWEYDGKDWTQVKTKTSPPGRSVPTMDFDRARLRIVMFGGGNTTGQGLGDTWEYDITQKDWKQITTKNAPSARTYPRMAYDSLRKRMVLYGGINIADTWEYDGKDWTQIKTKNVPPPRSFPTEMAYDLVRQRVILFGGRTTLNDTWEFNGASTTLTANPATISIATGGTQTFTLAAGSAHSARLYWIFGSLTGTSPGVTLQSGVGPVTIPLNPDIWTDITIAFANSGFLVNTRGTLSNTGGATASFVVPKMTNQSSIGVKFHHAYLVYDAQSNFYMASNPVELTLVK